MDIQQAQNLKGQFNKLADLYINLSKENVKLKEELKFQQTLSSLSDLPVKKDREAILFIGADVSGSMGLWEKEMGRQIKHIIQNKLKQSYGNVTVRYFHHHILSNEVEEHDFLATSESGGTIASSVYRQMNKELEDHDYESSKVDTYIIHLSDGDTLLSDRDRAKKLVEKITNKADMLIYFELNQHSRNSELYQGVFKYSDNPKVYSYVIRGQEDILKHTNGLLTDILS